jgi:ribosomal protein S18 acetylase RimI-like enzyme
MVQRQVQIIQVTQVDDRLLAAVTRLLPQLNPSHLAPSRQELEEMLKAGASHLLVACEPDAGGDIIGMLTLVVFRTPAGVHAWIEDVVVDETQRGRGIGEALTRCGMALAQELGASHVDLTSRPSREAANRLYQRLGFQRRETNTYRFTF